MRMAWTLQPHQSPLRPETEGTASIARTVSDVSVSRLQNIHSMTIRESTTRPLPLTPRISQVPLPRRSVFSGGSCIFFLLLEHTNPIHPLTLQRTSSTPLPRRFERPGVLEVGIRVGTQSDHPEELLPPPLCPLLRHSPHPRLP